MQANHILPDVVEDGELEDGEVEGVEAARRDQLPELSSDTREKVPNCFYR